MIPGTLRSRLYTLLQVRPSEGEIVALLIALMFLPSAGGAVGSPGIEALFFARFGVEFLPYMYIALGGVTLVTSLAITVLLDRVSRTRLYLALSALLALALVAARILVGFDITWFYPVLWLGMTLMWTLQGLLTWGIASAVCDTRQAKRLFPLFGAGAILGVAAGGFITPALIPLIGTENLLLVWAFTLAISLVLVARLMRFSLQTGNPSRHRQPPPVTAALQQGYRFVRGSALMRWISVMATLLALLYFSLSFPFAKAVTAELPNEADLAAFFGTFQGATTAVAFVGAFLIANRLYAYVGFMAVLLAYPVIYLIGFASVSITNALIPLVVFRFVQVVWYQGVAATAYQALFNLVPEAHREQTRAFIDGVPGQFGNILAGLLLLLTETFFRPVHLYYAGAIIAGVTVYVVWKARASYSGALRQALQAGQQDIFVAGEDAFGSTLRDTTTIATVMAGLASDDPATRRIAVEILGEMAVPQAADALVDALTDEDAGVRAGALRSLAHANVATALLEVATCIDDPEPDVRLQAVDALRQLTGYRRGMIAFLDRQLDDPDPEVRCKVAVLLLQFGPHPQAEGILHHLARSEEVGERVIALEGFAMWADSSGLEVAQQAMADADPAVRRAAAEALARIDSAQCLWVLINQGLADDNQSVIETAAHALGDVGERALVPVVEALGNPNLEHGVLRALRGLPARQESDALRAYARAKIDQALHYDAMRAGFVPLAQFDLRDRLLRDLAAAWARKHGERALRAVGLLDDPTAVDMAVRNLYSRNPGQRANALEMLDSIHDRDLIRPVLGVWENANEEPPDRNPPADLSAYRQQWIVRALKDDDSWIRATAALSACDLDGSEVIESLEQLAESDPDALVCQIAVGSLQGGNMVDTLATLSTMERILFLHQVPIFADLPPDELKRVADIAHERLFASGEIITREGDVGDEIYIVVNGEVRVTTRNEHGDEIELGRKTTGEYVGEMAIISHEPRTATLTAVGNVRTLTIEQNAFETILRERPEISLVIMRALITLLKEYQSELMARPASPHNPQSGS